MRSIAFIILGTAWIFCGVVVPAILQRNPKGASRHPQTKRQSMLCWPYQMEWEWPRRLRTFEFPHAFSMPLRWHVPNL